MTRVAAFLIIAALAGACGGKDGSSAPKAGDPPVLANTGESQWVIQQTPPSNVAIVFIHGVFGDVVDTWKHPNGNRLFDLVNTVPGIAGKADMLAFGFPSSMFKSGSFDIREAANYLHLRLEHHGVLQLPYQKIILVGHSMGGLVALREYTAHPEIRARIPLMILLATPQEGSFVANIGQHIFTRNPALPQLTLADGNSILKTISDDWSLIPKVERPMVRCAYEHLTTYGLMIVPWSSATRFCDDAPPPIQANHMDIVKAENADTGAAVVVSAALKTYVFNKPIGPKLETPDFRSEGDHDVVELASAAGKQTARLINSGGSPLRYTIAQISDAHLIIWPDDTPKELAPGKPDRLTFQLGFGATASQYGFVLQSDGAADRQIIVKVPDLQSVRAEQAQVVREAAASIKALLADDAQRQKLAAATSEDRTAAGLVVEAAHRAIVGFSPDMPESASWVLTAQALNALNWPGLAANALTRAEDASPKVTALPGVLQLASEVSGWSGNREVFRRTATPLPPVVQSAPPSNWLVTTAGVEYTTGLASLMLQVPSLKVFALSLKGDAQKAAGDAVGARESFQEAARVRPTPSITERLSTVSEMRERTVPNGSTTTPSGPTGRAVDVVTLPARSGRSVVAIPKDEQLQGGARAGRAATARGP